MKIIVGLGNPGTEYKNTRHNVGFEAIDLLIAKLKKEGIRLKTVSKKKETGMQANIFEGIFNDKKIIIAKPKTYMNESGIAVNKIAKFYKINPENIWIISDDLDLPLGSIRIRKSGGSGGHKGLESIINKLNSKNFVRFRLGIAGEQQKYLDNDAVKNYVLSHFNRAEKMEIKKALEQLVDSVVLSLSTNIEQAMNKYNR